MPENTGKTTPTNERINQLNQRIENSIKNDGISSETAERFLYNERVKIPALRFTMLQMLGSVAEIYAQFYFDILAYLEEKVEEKKLLLNEVGDLSQSYFRTVKRLADDNYPMEKLEVFLSERLTETDGEYPKPCELNELCVSFQKEQRQSLEESREAALNVKVQMDKLLEMLSSMQSALDKQRESMEKDHGVTQDMATEILKMLTALENMVSLQTESIREASERISENGQKLEDCETAVKEGRKDTHEMLLQLEEKLDSPGPYRTTEESSVQGASGGAAASFKKLLSRRREKPGKEKKEEDAIPGDASVKRLILLLKEYNCPGTVRDKVQDALSAGVSMEEICLAVKDAYENGAEEAEEMLMDVLDIMILAKN